MAKRKVGTAKAQKAKEQLPVQLLIVFLTALIVLGVVLSQTR